MRPPESPRREGKRREDEDYFVIEVKSRLLVLSQRLTSRRCRSIAILGAPIAILCWESLNLAFLLMRKNWHRGGRKRGTLSSSSTWSMSPPASQSLCHSSHTPTFWGFSGVCGFFNLVDTGTCLKAQRECYGATAFSILEVPTCSCIRRGGDTPACNRYFFSCITCMILGL